MPYQLLVVAACFSSVLAIGWAGEPPFLLSKILSNLTPFIPLSLSRRGGIYLAQEDTDLLTYVLRNITYIKFSNYSCL